MRHRLPIAGRVDRSWLRAVLLRLQRKDPAAFDAIFAAYSPPVERYLAAILRREDAVDTGQQVFLDLHLHSISVATEPEAFEHWLFMVARHRAIDFIRRERRVDITDAASLDALLERRRKDDAPWERADVEPFVRRLPPVQRETLALRYVYSFSTEEIATTLGKSQAAVRQIESRTLGRLRAQLTDDDSPNVDGCSGLSASPAPAGRA